MVKLTVHGLEFSIETAATVAEFGKPVTKLTVELIREKGFSVPRGLARFCMAWIWGQWLRVGSENEVRSKVRAFVDRGMKMQAKSPLFYMRPLADLNLLHCAIFASDKSQLMKLAGRLVDASKKYEPKNDGELYASAWCGMLKYWILGDLKTARRQSELIWGAYRPPYFSAASKPLVAPWLEGNWKGFLKAQQKDFDRRWARGRKDGTVRSETKDRVLVTVQGFPIEQKWCWSHCGLALLAYRKGVEVATDPFWFPPHALKCV